MTRIRTVEEVEWQSSAVLYHGRKAHVIDIPAGRVGFSASFLKWISYEDSDRSFGVVDIDLVSRKDLTYIEEDD
jgi:hypothetical protein